MKFSPESGIIVVHARQFANHAVGHSDGIDRNANEASYIEDCGGRFMGWGVHVPQAAHAFTSAGSGGMLF